MNVIEHIKEYWKWVVLSDPITKYTIVFVVGMIAMAIIWAVFS